MPSADLLTNVTPIPSGSWCAIGYYQNILGALDISATWPEIATEWAGYLPDTYTQGRLSINDTFNQKNARVELQVNGGDTTIGALATYANNISPKVSIESVTVYGASKPSDGQWESDVANNGTGMAKCLDSPLACAMKTLALPVVLVLLLAGVVVYAAHKGSGSKSWL